MTTNPTDDCIQPQKSLIEKLRLKTFVIDDTGTQHLDFIDVMNVIGTHEDGCAALIIELSSAIHSLIGYCEALLPGTVVTEAWEDRLKSHYIPKVKKLIDAINMGDDEQAKRIMENGNALGEPAHETASSYAGCAQPSLTTMTAPDFVGSGDTSPGYAIRKDAYLGAVANHNEDKLDMVEDSK